MINETNERQDQNTEYKELFLSILTW